MSEATQRYLQQEDLAAHFNDSIRDLAPKAGYDYNAGEGDSAAAEDNLVDAAILARYMPPGLYVEFVSQYPVDWESTDYADTRVQDAIRTLNQRPEIQAEYKARGITPAG